MLKNKTSEILLKCLQYLKMQIKLNRSSYRFPFHVQFDKIGNRMTRTNNIIFNSLCNSTVELVPKSPPFSNKSFHHNSLFLKK